MKPANLILLAPLVAAMAFSASAKSQSPPQDSAATIVQSSQSAKLTGYVREGTMKYPLATDHFKYLYLHLNDPIDVFIGAVGTHTHYVFHAYDVGLEANPVPRHELESEIGKRVTVVGRLPAPPGANLLAPFALTMFVQAVEPSK